MDVFVFIYDVSNRFNERMDTSAPSIFGIWIIALVLVYTYKRIQKEGLGRGVYLGVWALVEAAMAFGVLYFLPRITADYLDNPSITTKIRWVLFYLVIPIWYFATHKTSGRRGASFVFIILTTFLLGWLYNHWVGLIIISLPVFLTFLYVVYKTAQVIIPSTAPEDREEPWKKARALFMYLLGIQHPIWMAEAKAGRKFDERIPGDTRQDIGKPGVVLTWSHQVAGISKGIEFDRVDGPGVVFTEQYESPVALVDLRKQLRVTVVDTVTKDGMKVPSIVFAAFAVDKDQRSRAEYAKLRRINGKRFEIDHPEGSFPFSTGRVHAVMGTSGVNTTPRDNNEKAVFHWDEWAVKQVEHATRQVVSERSLDELWRPQSNGSGVSALDEMAVDLKNLLEPKLADVGVRLFGVRVVNYDLPEDNPISVQNIKTWSSYWEQRIAEANADIEIIYREEIEKAHAYSKSVLLSAIADSISKAREINDDLPRHVIAQYFVHALEEYIKKQPGLDIADSKQRLDTIKEFLMYNRTEGSE